MHILNIIAYCAGFIIAVFVGSTFVEKVLSKLKLPQQQRKILLEESIPEAGKIIGMLERALTILLIYLNEPAAVAIIFTAKSIIRFEKAKQRPFAEYYLIGTLTSITFSVIIGIIINAIIRF